MGDWLMMRPETVSPNRPKGLFIDTSPAQCSIYESGRMVLYRADYALLINNPVNGLFVDATNRSPMVEKIFATSAAARDHV
jgi:hypothetical protein